MFCSLLNHPLKIFPVSYKINIIQYTYDSACLSNGMPKQSTRSRKFRPEKDTAKQEVFRLRTSIHLLLALAGEQGWLKDEYQSELANVLHTYETQNDVLDLTADLETCYRAQKHYQQNVVELRQDIKELVEKAKRGGWYDEISDIAVSYTTNDNIKYLRADLQGLQQHLYTIDNGSLASDHATKTFRALLQLIRQYQPSTRCTGEVPKNIRWLLYLSKTTNLKACIPASKEGQVYTVHFGKRLWWKPFGNIALTSTNVYQHITIMWMDGTAHFKIADGLAESIRKCTAPLIILLVAVYMPADMYDKSKKGDETLVGHQNLIIIDKANNTWERFEPNGSAAFPWFEDFFSAKPVQQLMPSKQYRFIPVSEVCPNLGPQGKQGMADTDTYRCPDGGFCQVFSVMYAHLRMELLSEPSESIYSLWLSLNGHELLDIIRRYMSWIDSVVPDENDKAALKRFDKKYML